MATELSGLCGVQKSPLIGVWRRFTGMWVAVGLVTVLGLVYAVTAGWAQGPDSPGVGTSSPMAEATAGFQASFPAYRVRLRDKTELGPVPALEVYRNEQLIFRFPLVSGLDSATDREHLSDIRYRVHPLEANKQGALYEIVATATSTLWAKREFHWRLYADHLEFDQTAMGEGKLGRCYFFSDGRPGRWDKGLSDGAAWNSTLMADRYWSPSPNHANQWEFSIAEPQTLGFSSDAHKGSEEDFRPAQMADLFSPPPLMLAFHRSGEWASIGIGTPPGQYRFPALEYSGSRYAGAAWWVDYLGYQTLSGVPGSEFHSPVAAVHFAYSALDTLEKYTQWLRRSGFGTEPGYPDVAWHHLPVFCGWAEQTTQAVPYGRPPNTESTQKNYVAWVAELERRNLPVGTIVIDDKWQKGYGSFDIDTEKWPDLKGFVAAQHAHGRHVLLWVPVAHWDGLPDALCVHGEDGKCIAPDLGNPGYEAFLRARIRYLVETVGVDGFKEDWVWAPDAAGLPVPPEFAGIEAVRRFQQILYSETHRWRPDAMVETQTTNLAFRDSSDVLRLNDIWYATRDVVGTMRERARIAHISGWQLVDTDNASSTTLETWWQYMEAQPSIGIPALYFLHRTESTLEEPPPSDWVALAGIWQRYIAALPENASAEKGN
ncbi:MAG: TIM-barrel domain-containing protein [Terracidiphilus sp.]